MNGESPDPRVRSWRSTGHRPPAGCSRLPGSKWLLSLNVRAVGQWHGWLCHQVHSDDFKTEADDPLYKSGEGSLVGQLGAEGGRLRACGDLAVVELCA